MKRGWKRIVLSYAHDFGMAALSFWLALWFRLGDELVAWPPDILWPAFGAFMAAAAIAFPMLRIGGGIWRYVAVDDFIKIAQAAALTLAIFLLLLFSLTRLELFPRSFVVIDFFIMVGLLSGPRFGYRLIKDRELSSIFERGTHRRVPVLLVGSGDGTDLFIREMTRTRDAPFRVVGILDDRDSRVGRTIRGIKVLGTVDELESIAARLARRSLAPERLIITRSAMDGSVIANLIDRADALGIGIGRLPRLTTFDRADTSGSTESGALSPRPIRVEDLLGRPQAVLDQASISALIQGRRVVVTGAGGTIGGELARQVADRDPAELTLIDHSEYALYQIDLDIGERHPDLARTARIGDVREVAGIRRIFEDIQPEIVFHAAAMKHVPLMEANPLDAILTNIIGTRVVAEAATAAGAEAMVLISTDKAVNPTSVMGATKRVAEMVCQSLDLERVQTAGTTEKAPERRTRFVTVRFGNVLGSTGSVIPLFQRQLARGGPLTVTHPEITRYFMTVREAVELVLQASTLQDETLETGGGICVLDMGEPVKIADLARQMIRLAGLTPDHDVRIAFTGLRPGEKLYEELFHDAEDLVETADPAIRVARPRTADVAVLRRALDELEAAARRRDHADGIERLRRLVPEMTTPGATPPVSGSDGAAAAR